MEPQNPKKCSLTSAFAKVLEAWSVSLLGLDLHVYFITVHLHIFKENMSIMKPNTFVKSLRGAFISSGEFF